MTEFADTDFVLDKMIEAALKAGEIISNARDTNFTVEHKPNAPSEASSVVTEIDRKSEATILEILNPVCEKLGIGLLSEEQEDDGSRLNRPYFFAIDPMDGTLAFTKGSEGYSVSIGLVDNYGEAKMGVIYNPERDDLYHAVKHRGAFKNQKQWTIPESFRKPITFVMDPSSLKFPRFQYLIHQIKYCLKAQEFEIGNDITCGGAAMNAIWVAEYSPAFYLKTPKTSPGGGCIWDFAASSCILSEAGGNVFSFRGEKLLLNLPETTYMNSQGCIYASHSAIYKLLQPALKSFEV